MERNDPVRNSHTSTADLLTWSENTPSSAPVGDPAARPGNRNHLQPAGAISKALFGGKMTEEEAESVLKMKLCSGSKMREMTGSRIFAADTENEALESSSALSTPNNKTGLRIYQQAVNAMSQISFSADESVSPKKPTTITEVAKQRELSGTLENESEAKTKKQPSDAKCRELSGHDIFGPPSEFPAKTVAARNLELKDNKHIGGPTPRNIHTSVKVSNPAGGRSNIMFGEEEETPVKTAKKIHNQRVAELTSNRIFFRGGDDAPLPPGLSEKPPSVAKLREMTGSDIFGDGKAASRDYHGGVRKPPGGVSTIALV